MSIFYTLLVVYVFLSNKFYESLRIFSDPETDKYLFFVAQCLSRMKDAVTATNDFILRRRSVTLTPENYWRHDLKKLK